MKRFLLASVAFVVAASPALAIARYNSESMSCQAAQNLVQREGAVILRYPSDQVRGLELFDRYVADTAYCDPDRYAKQEYIPTSDTKHCIVLACAQRSDDGDFDN
jgi:hypothetical protein